jgi:hypothetical protein
MTRALLLSLALVACREDPGNPVYPDPIANTMDTGEADPNFFLGPDPFEGQDRLSLSVFYEGGFTEQLLLDEVTVHYYVYENTFTQEVDLIDRVEGYQSDILVQGGVGWLGGGVHSDVPTDFSDWTTLHVSVKSNDMPDVNFGMNGGVEASAAASAYGYVPDGSWHHLAIPLADLESQGVDLTNISVALLMIADQGSAGSTLHIDNLYLSKD